MAYTVGDIEPLDITSNKRVYTGTWTGGAPTAGEIKTALKKITYFSGTGAGTVGASAGVITFTSAETSGYWRAEGY